MLLIAAKMGLVKLSHCKGWTRAGLAKICLSVSLSVSPCSGAATHITAMIASTPEWLS